MKNNYTANDLIIRSQLALSNDELIIIAITIYCPLLAASQARDEGFYSETCIKTETKNSMYSRIHGKPGASSVFFLTMLKRFYPEIFWSMSRINKVNKKLISKEKINHVWKKSFKN